MQNAYNEPVGPFFSFCAGGPSDSAQILKVTVYFLFVCLLSLIEIEFCSTLTLRHVIKNFFIYALIEFVSFAFFLLFSNFSASGLARQLDLVAPHPDLRAVH